MSKLEVIRAWKDMEYRLSLRESELGALPANPAGPIDLSEIELSAVAGGTDGIMPTGCLPTCTLDGCPTIGGPYDFPGWTICTWLSALALCMCYGEGTGLL